MEPLPLSVSRAGFVLDPTAFPLVYVWSPPDAAMTINCVAMFERAYRELAAMYHEKCVTVSNSSQKLPSSEVRKALGQMIKRLEPELDIVGGPSVYVISSASGRGLMTALNWLARPKAPQHFVADNAAAADMAEELLIKLGHELDVTCRVFLKRIRQGHGYDRELAARRIHG